MRPHKLFLVSLLLAILLHGLLLGWLPVPEFTRAPPPLEVTMLPEPLPPVTPPVRKPAKKEKPAEAAPKPTPTPTPAPPPVETGIPDTAPPVPSAPPVLATPEPAAPPIPVPAPTPVEPTPPPPPPPPAAPPPKVKTVAEQRLAELPPIGEIDYDVSFGSVDLPVARGTLRWRFENGRYELNLEARAVGIARLIKSNPVIQTSTGRTTPEGLKPDEYHVIGRSSETDEAIAKFDWVNGVLSLSPAGTTFPLSEGAQDLLSFFFQFSLSPPEAEGASRAITNGRKLDKYSYELIERSTLKLPIGSVDTLHVSRLTGLNEDSFDIWLGENYHLLPVQMKFFARGRRLTLYAKSIRVGSILK